MRTRAWIFTRPAGYMCMNLCGDSYIRAEQAHTLWHANVWIRRKEIMFSYVLPFTYALMQLLYTRVYIILIRTYALIDITYEDSSLYTRNLALEISITLFDVVWLARRQTARSLSTDGENKLMNPFWWSNSNQATIDRILICCGFWKFDVLLKINWTRHWVSILFKKKVENCWTILSISLEINSTRWHPQSCTRD